MDLSRVPLVSVRRTSPSDAIAYTTPVKQGRCTCHNPDFAFARSPDCQVVQDRTYTPDLLLVLNDGPGDKRPGKAIYLEVKGYFPGPKRNLFRTARSQHPELDIRLIASSDHWVTKGKTRLSDWAKRFKIPFHVWDGKLPESWL